MKVEHGPYQATLLDLLRRSFDVRCLIAACIGPAVVPPIVLCGIDWGSAHVFGRDYRNGSPVLAQTDPAVPAAPACVASFLPASTVATASCDGIAAHVCSVEITQEDGLLAASMEDIARALQFLSDACPALTDLSLGVTPKGTMTGKDNRLLAIIGTMVGLRSLALPHVEVTTAAVAHLASLPHLEHLSSTLEMAVGGLCAAPPDDLRVASPAVRSAQQPPGSPSPLWHLRCEAAALPYLQGLPQLRSLTLNVRGCRNINSAQFALLATMPGVTTLQLHGCLTYPRMPATAEVCAAIGRAVSVRELLLRGSFHVDLEGLGILLGGLTALEFLHVNLPRLERGPEALAAVLVTSPSLTRLRLRASSFGARDAQLLCELLPQQDITVW